MRVATMAMLHGRVNEGVTMLNDREKVIAGKEKSEKM